VLLSSGYKCWSKQVRSHTPAILRALWEVWRQDLLVRERGSAVSGVVLDIHHVVLDIHQAEWFGTSIKGVVLDGVVLDIHQAEWFGTSIKGVVLDGVVRDIHRRGSGHPSQRGSGHPSSGMVRDIHKSTRFGTRFGTSIKDGMVRDIHQLVYHRSGGG
jgi:hypothetical protein